MLLGGKGICARNSTFIVEPLEADYEMRYRSPLGSALLLGALALAVSACGGGDSGDLRRGSTPAATKAESPEKAQPSVELVGSGF